MTTRDGNRRDRSIYQDAGFGITCIDTGLARAGLAACYVMQEGREAAVIETGTAHTVPRILDCLDQQGVAREQVPYVIITHVHLDHAGGAGALMQALPNAKLVVHPRAARHMADPGKLQAGTIAVYGEEKYKQIYGELIPVPEQRLVVADDNFELQLGNRRLKFFDTPGHARHHFCVYDAASHGIFTGDTLGIAYKDLQVDGNNFIMPTTTPVQFDPEALKASIDRLMTLNPKRFFLTHYGRVESTERHAQILKQEIDNYVAIARAHQNDENRHARLQQALTEHTLAALQQHGSPLPEDEQRYLIANDMVLNAQGLDHWLTTLENKT